LFAALPGATRDLPEIAGTVRVAARPVQDGFPWPDFFLIPQVSAKFGQGLESGAFCSKQKRNRAEAVPFDEE